MTNIFDSFAKEILGASPFRVAAVYMPQGGAGKSINIDLTLEYVTTGDVGEVDIGLPGPAALCASADVPAAKRGDTLVIGDTTYYVQEPRPQGDGFTLLILSRDA